ncbi:MAG: hypothetical protein ABIH23_22435 [bacterium]
MGDKVPEEINPKIGELVAAIGKKRRELGFLEWGQLPIEEVVKRLQEQPGKGGAKRSGSKRKPGGKTDRGD